MECNCNNNNSNGGVIPWVRGNRLPLIICVYENVVTQEQVGDSTLTVNEMTRVPYEIQDNDTVTVIMKSGFRQVAMPFTTDGNKVMVTDNGELPTGAYTVEVTIEQGNGARGRWQETRQVRIYENTSEAQLGGMYSIDADLFFYAKGDTGVGIANITPNPDDTLTITMTDGTTYTTNAVRGEQGEQGEPGERGVSIVSFDVTGQTDVSVIYTVTYSDDTTQEVAVPKGPQGDTGLTGNGISSTALNSDYTLTIAYTDGTTYTTPSIRGPQGAQGVSVIGFSQTGETATNTMYNLVFSDGRTQSVAIPKGLKGDKGDAGNPGPQGEQGPKGDTVTATDYTLYSVQGSDSQGAMSQDATTKAISAQTGYYTCGTAAGTAPKVVTVENGNLYKRTLGGHFKVRMTNANTAASGVTLQVGSETAAALLYNGEAVSASNTWEAGEVISVFYDGVRYQSSNAQGGSRFTSAVNVSFVPIKGKVSIIGDSISTFYSTVPSGYNYFYPEYDVATIRQMWWSILFSLTNSKREVNASYSGSRVTTYSGRPNFYSRTSAEFLGNPDYIIVELGTNDSSNNIALGTPDFNAEISSLAEDKFYPAYIKGVKSLMENYPNAKIVLLVLMMKDSYAQAIKTIGKHFGLEVIEAREYDYLGGVHPTAAGMENIVRSIVKYYLNYNVSEDAVRDYIYTDSKTLAVGQTYEKDEAVVTQDKRLVRTAQKIYPMTLADEVEIGELKAYRNATYKALKEVKPYHYDSENPYEDGDYALGSPAILSLTVTRAQDGGDISASFGDNEVSITSEGTDSVADIASGIASAFNAVENIGWTFSYNNNVVTATCDENGDNSGIEFSIVGGAGTGIFGEVTVVAGTADTAEGADDGTPTVFTLTLTMGEGTIDVTIGEVTNTITITSTDEASDIASLIAAATWEGFILSVDSEDNTKVVVTATEGGLVDAPTIAENIFGVGGTGAVETAGSTVLKKYNGTNETWDTVTITNYPTDTSMWESVDAGYIADEENGYVIQDTVNADITAQVNNAVGNHNKEEAIPISIATYAYISSNGIVASGSGSTYRKASQAIDVTKYSHVYIKFYLTSAYSAITAFATNDNLIVGKVLYNNTNDYVLYPVPAGATRLYITTVIAQSSISVIGVLKYNVKEITDDLYTKIEEVDEKADKNEEIILPSTNTNYRILASTGKFSTDTDDKHLFYQVVPGATYKVVVKPDAALAFQYGWTIDTYWEYGKTPHYSSGETNCHSIAKGTTGFITAPQDAKYICITTKYDGGDTRPEYFGRFRNLVERLDTLEEIGDSVKEVATEVDISANVYPPIYYYLWENSNKFSTDGTGHHINIPIIRGATYRMVCPAKTAYAFVTDAKIGTAYGLTPNFCAGESVHVVSAGTYDIIAPQDAKFITITVKVKGSVVDRRPTYFAKVDKVANQLSENTSNIQTSDALIFDYYGEKINLNQKYGLMAANTAYYSGGLQSTACYGDYIVSLNKGMTQMCLQKMTSALYKLATIVPPANNTTKYHGNQCNFGNQKYDENDYFPVLYASCFGSDRESTACVLVYRITPTFSEETGEISSFTASIVQTIYLPQSQAGVFYGGNGNVAIDRQRNMMYAYHGTGTTYDGVTLITRFSRIPPLFDSNNEPISVVEFGYTANDNPNYYMARTFEAPMGSYTNQGGAIWNGKLYIVRGGPSTYVDLYCVDLIQERLVSMINLKDAQDAKTSELGGNNWKFEPEGLFIWKNDIYISTSLSTIVKILL